jgi:hypothetical protein
MVAAVNVADFLPAATVTLAGTDAPFVLLSVTTMPPAGAEPLIVTVPVEELPPFKLDGLSKTLEGATGFTVSVPLADVPLADAVMVTVVLVATRLVVAVNDAVFLPAATVMMAGTEAPLVLLSVTLRPPVGAAPLMVTVPIDDAPPVTLAGLSATVDGTGAFTVSAPVADVPLAEAVIVAVMLETTGTDVAVNVAVLLPADTVTLAGTAAPLVLVRLTISPPVGAAPLVVTVPVDEFPPVTLVGLSTRLDGTAAITESVPLADVPLADAVMVTAVLETTGTVVAVNVAVVLPAATVILLGTVVLGSSLLREIESPPVGAAPLRDTVPVDDAPPVTLAGLSATLDGTVDLNKDTKAVPPRGSLFVV